MSSVESPTRPDPGTLANNGLLIMCLTRSVRNGESAFETAPSFISKVLKADAWRHWTDAGGEHRWGAKEFEKFVTTQPPDGLGISVKGLLALVSPDTETWVLLQAALRDNAGVPKGNENASGSRGDTPAGGPCDSIRDDVTDCSEPATIPIRTRDYSKEAHTGNSTSYGIRRLEKNRPDLLDRVKGGDLSVHRAMVLAGFRKETVAIPLEPHAAARLIAKHLQGAELASLVRDLSEQVAGSKAPATPPVITTAIPDTDEQEDFDEDMAFEETWVQFKGYATEVFRKLAPDRRWLFAGRLNTLGIRFREELGFGQVTDIEVEVAGA